MAASQEKKRGNLPEFAPSAQPGLFLGWHVQPGGEGSMVEGRPHREPGGRGEVPEEGNQVHHGLENTEHLFRLRKYLVSSQELGRRNERFGYDKES